MPMPEPLTNARVHEWLTAALDDAVTKMHTSRLQLNSAAMWWFLTKLSPEERAEILGEYTKVLALLHQQHAEADGQAGGKAKGGRKPKGK
jgi:hypothetical protein